MASTMERISLNVPAVARAQLRELARRSGKTESEVARELLLTALKEVRKQAFYREVAARQTPERRARDLAILRAFERLGG